MPEAKREPDEEGDDAEELSGDALDFDDLKAQRNVAGLLTLAKAYRAGTAPGGRDMKRCLEAYRAAAELGSADAEYAVALFCMSGGIVTQDLKEGAARLRTAAEKGSVPAKVYLGNLYELGIQYKADPDKADVWYRNAARGARVSAPAGTDEYARELAELGCVRYVLSLVESGAVDGDEKARLLQRARAHGYKLSRGVAGEGKPQDEPAADRPTLLGALESVEAGAARGSSPKAAASAGDVTRPDTKTPDAGSAQASERKVEKKREQSSATKKTSDSSRRTAIGLAAFGYALLFAVAGIGAGYAATLGARELVARGHLLPMLGARAHLVFPIVLALVGVLPTWLVYRFGTVLKALAIGGAFAGIGWVAWGTGQAALHGHRPVQALTFGIAGFLAGLLVLGLLGGTKREPPRPRRHPSG